jgi:hypothetical protein
VRRTSTGLAATTAPAAVVILPVFGSALRTGFFFAVCFARFVMLISVPIP